MAKIENIDEWHKIGNKLTQYLGICPCQRKLKSFVELLLEIHRKIGGEEALWHELTSHELLITALLESRNLISHGTNCEYPFVGDPSFWTWLYTIKDSPHLSDN